MTPRGQAALCALALASSEKPPDESFPQFAERICRNYIAAAAADARRQAIEEVAAEYHDALADFFESEWRREPLMGFAEEHFETAKRHRSYSKEIREQVWIKADALLPPAPEEGGK